MGITSGASDFPGKKGEELHSCPRGLLSVVALDQNNPSPMEHVSLYILVQIFGVLSRYVWQSSMRRLEW